MNHFLDLAGETISDRDGTYGDATETGYRIALMWNAYLELNKPPLGPVEVMRMLELMKIVRSNTENDLIGAVGYAALAANAAQPQVDSLSSPPKVNFELEPPEWWEQDEDCDCKWCEQARAKQ